MIEANTLNLFKEEVLSSELPVLVDFWAEWCGPCKMVAPEIDKLASENAGKLKVVKVNVDLNPEIAMKYNILSIPTIALFKNGELAGLTIGAKSANRIAQELGI